MSLRIKSMFFSASFRILHARESAMPFRCARAGEAMDGRASFGCRSHSSKSCLSLCDYILLSHLSCSSTPAAHHTRRAPSHPQANANMEALQRKDAEIQGLTRQMHNLNNQVRLAARLHQVKSFLQGLNRV